MRHMDANKNSLKDKLGSAKGPQNMPRGYTGSNKKERFQQKEKKLSKLLIKPRRNKILPEFDKKKLVTVYLDKVFVTILDTGRLFHLRATV